MDNAVQTVQRKIDVLSFLSHVVQSNTEFYKSDFSYDIAVLQNAAREHGMTNRSFLWMSRRSGTWCLNERDVFLRDTGAFSTWTYYETAAAGIQAYRIAVTGCQEGTVIGDIFPLNYTEHVRRVKQNAATVNSDASVVYGDAGNPNEVVLTWKRTSSDFYDTLVDDAHVFTYGLELTKLFSDGKGDFSKVEFILHNDTDDYFVKAELNEAEGIYYVVDHVEAEADATHFIPMSADPNEGKIVVKGLEDDTYTITEVRTDNGYTLLKDDIEVVISQTETAEICDIYASDVLGLIQNDPRYATIIHDTGDLKNMPQKHLEHHLLTASATVDGNAVTMLTDNGSANAEAPLRVVNTRGFDLPKTGDNGTKMLTIAGTLLILCAGGCVALLIVSKRKRNTK